MLEWAIVISARLPVAELLKRAEEAATLAPPFVQAARETTARALRRIMCCFFIRFVLKDSAFLKYPYSHNLQSLFLARFLAFFWLNFPCLWTTGINKRQSLGWSQLCFFCRFFVW